MPPKKKGGGQQPSQKTIQKKKEKIIEDKTFGMKNKKGKKQQQLIKQVTNQVNFGQKSSNKLEQQKFEDKKNSDQIKEKEQMDKLFNPVSQKVSTGADPKSVLCAFYKAGTCTKGDKCKFSHDMSLDRKSEKKSIYIDARGGDDDALEEDTIDKWDQEKLEAVVSKKHGNEKAKPKTEIVCKYFLEAIEKSLYGWFWSCPNGGDKCMYRHALPPGFVLKKDKKKETEETVSLEEVIELERSSLGQNLTKVTYETFISWKKRRLTEKKEKEEANMKKKRAEMKAGRMVGISGREVFQFQPSLANEGDTNTEEDTAVYEREIETNENTNQLFVKLTFEELIAAATQDEINATTTDSQHRDNEAPVASSNNNIGDEDDDANKLGEAAAYPEEISPAEVEQEEDTAENIEDIHIEEDLFMDELDEDLENLDLDD